MHPIDRDSSRFAGDPLRRLVHVDGRQALVGTRGWTIAFFVPLADPLLLPDEFILEVRDVLDRKELMVVAIEMGEQGFTSETVLSLCFRQVSGRADFNPVRNVGLAATQAFPGLETTGGELVSETLATVVEVVGNVPNLSKDALSKLFDRSLDAIRSVQRSYGAVSGRPVQPISRQRCPPGLPMYKRKPESSPETWHGDSFLFLVHDLMELHALDAPSLDGEKLKAMNQIDRQLQMSSPFSNAAALLQDGLRMADQEGDAWNAVALLASSCERMLNELIGCLMWEDGLRPEDCSRHFNSFIVALVAGSEFKSRLGGGWDKEGAHPIGDWYRDVALVRNEMLHGGSFPDAAAASRARAATLGLRDFIKDQLVDALDRYPRTAWLLLGSNQFDASLCALHLDRLLADPSETHWQSTAAR